MPVKEVIVFMKVTSDKMLRKLKIHFTCRLSMNKKVFYVYKITSLPAIFYGITKGYLLIIGIRLGITEEI